LNSADTHNSCANSSDLFFYSKLLFPDLIKCCVEPEGATVQVKVKSAKGPRLPERCPERPPDAEKYMGKIYILCGRTNLETCPEVGAHCMYKQHPSLWVYANKNEIVGALRRAGDACGWAHQVTQVNEDGRHTAWTVWVSCCSAGGCFERQGTTWRSSGVDSTVRGIPVLRKAVMKAARRLQVGTAAAATADAAGGCMENRRHRRRVPMTTVLRSKRPRGDNVGGVGGETGRCTMQ
jgi:hypothetical protein